jgi:Uma2 family endonuclease
MSTRTPPASPPEIKYPDCDGKPLSDNTLQYTWITTIKGGLEAVFRDDPNVFVAGDLLWYPVEGDNKTRLAPDTMVAIGRPKGYRGSYMQWKEGGLAPQVAFEVLSPKNRRPEMDRKREWYFRFGVDEYYEFDPDRVRLRGWIREGGEPREIVPMSGWTSPKLGIRFELADDLTIYGPDGQPFLPYEEVVRERTEAQRERAEAQRQHDEVQRQHDEVQRQRDEVQRQRDEAQRQRDEAQQRAERLAARLRELGLEPDE